jgi:hypothetical protein
LWFNIVVDTTKLTRLTVTDEIIFDVLQASKYGVGANRVCQDPASCYL